MEIGVVNIILRHNIMFYEIGTATISKKSDEI